MATLEEEKEEFLKHYGVRGMKWGVKKQARVLRREAKGQARLDRYQGSATKANVVSLGKAAVANIVLNRVAAAVSVSSAPPAVKAGTRLVAAVAGTAAWATSINEVVNVDAAQKKDV